MHDYATSLSKGIIGMGGSILAVISPMQEHLAWGLGIAVALLTIVSLAFDIRRKWRAREK